MEPDLRSPLPPWRPRHLARWVWRLTRDVWVEYRDDRVGDLAASITFWTILSIPAAALALVSALSSLEAIAGTSVSNDVEREIQQFVADTLVDSETLSAAISELFSGSNAGVITIAAFTRASVSACPPSGNFWPATACVVCPPNECPDMPMVRAPIEAVAY